MQSVSFNAFLLGMKAFGYWPILVSIFARLQCITSHLISSSLPKEPQDLPMVVGLQILTELMPDQILTDKQISSQSWRDYLKPCNQNTEGGRSGDKAGLIAVRIHLFSCCFSLPLPSFGLSPSGPSPPFFCSIQRGAVSWHIGGYAQKCLS